MAGVPLWWLEGCKPFPSDLVLGTRWIPPWGFRAAFTPETVICSIDGVIREESWSPWRVGRTASVGSQRNFPVGGACSRPGGRARGPRGGRFLARTASGGCERRSQEETDARSEPVRGAPACRLLPASAAPATPATADPAEAGAAERAATGPCLARRGPEPPRGR